MNSVNKRTQGAFATEGSQPTLLYLRKGLPRRFFCYLSWSIISDPVLDPSDDRGRPADRAAFETCSRHNRATGPPNLSTVTRYKAEIDAWLAVNATVVPAKTSPAEPSTQPKWWSCWKALEVPPVASSPPCWVPQPGQEAPELSQRHITAAAVPAEHFCPLARCVMREPVRDWRDPEHVYERSAITAFVRQHGCNPVTGQPMCLDHLRRDAFEEDAIRDWVAENTTTTSFSGGGRGDSGSGDGQAAAGQGRAGQQPAAAVLATAAAAAAGGGAGPSVPVTAAALTGAAGGDGGGNMALPRAGGSAAAAAPGAAAVTGDASIPLTPSRKCEDPLHPPLVGPSYSLSLSKRRARKWFGEGCEGRTLRVRVVLDEQLHPGEHSVQLCFMWPEKRFHLAQLSRVAEGCHHLGWSCVAGGVLVLYLRSPGEQLRRVGEGAAVREGRKRPLQRGQGDAAVDATARGLKAAGAAAASLHGAIGGQQQQQGVRGLGGDQQQQPAAVAPPQPAPAVAAGGSGQGGAGGSGGAAAGMVHGGGPTTGGMPSSGGGLGGGNACARPEDAGAGAAGSGVAAAAAAALGTSGSHGGAGGSGVRDQGAAGAAGAGAPAGSSDILLDPMHPCRNPLRPPLIKGVSWLQLSSKRTEEWFGSDAASKDIRTKVVLDGQVQPWECTTRLKHYPSQQVYKVQGLGCVVGTYLLGWSRIRGGVLVAHLRSPGLSAHAEAAPGVGSGNGGAAAGGATAAAGQDTANRVTGISQGYRERLFRRGSLLIHADHARQWFGDATCRTDVPVVVEMDGRVLAQTFKVRARLALRGYFRIAGTELHRAAAGKWFLGWSRPSPGGPLHLLLRTATQQEVAVAERLRHKKRSKKRRSGAQLRANEEDCEEEHSAGDNVEEEEEEGEKDNADGRDGGSDVGGGWVEEVTGEEDASREGHRGGGRQCKRSRRSVQQGPGSAAGGVGGP
ncbi:hypothetical protein Agub_g7699 [Astrephomene gubernaculifera]|uniref:U-box domain-containing protein n=1 Tax=Astrephomene gubernaculifera TaxID=47775 RepID=A0AAD3DUN2_9CHLO|nr:hypothetical protein Agub_g7699 [Astrephomene gubernaculifera]